jgi:hypothetical protein
MLSVLVARFGRLLLRWPPRSDIGHGLVNHRLPRVSKRFDTAPGVGVDVMVSLAGRV